ncbi:hypothetical protein D5S18_17170 [Nocardia panacis]|uniref:WXG100 family type VII secretion target n=1 Tax=Nocardia panacis TaxID=2340916 RepID=A0A3A4KAP1_9NOCA|nr:hypothetical protein [Nocardia panacis]RJO75105.1 hypothetical protein D5S18_17170 [Nocardia panacis]
MADKVEVTPHELRKVADDLDGSARNVKAVLDRLAGARHAHEGKWGGDDFGKQFSGGNGYKKGAENLDSAVGSKVQLLHDYAGGLRGGADELEGAEDDNRRRFKS